MKELEGLGIKSPNGKEKWNKRTVELTLIKRKYIGETEILKSDEKGKCILASDNNPAIISKEVFDAVQKKIQRSIITIDKDGTKHHSANKYNSKKKKMYLKERVMLYDIE